MIESLVGRRFGKLKVIERAEDYIPPTQKNRVPRYLCVCDCGTEKIINHYSLTGGVTVSCGCSKKERMLNMNNNSFKDLTGKRFGKLLVIERTDDYINPNGRKSTQWLCECDCGTKKPFKASSLISNHTKSCGCTHKKSLIGQVFGRLTVIGQGDSVKSPCGCSTTTWVCQCECENITTVRRTDLTKGTTQSCGCTISRGERKIIDILVANEIVFKSQKIFDDCILDSGYKARFDFFVDESYIIEYDGIQHFEYSNNGWNNKEYFDKQQISDETKNKYCKDNSIPIIRIPYWHYDYICVDDLLLKTSKFII